MPLIRPEITVDVSDVLHEVGLTHPGKGESNRSSRLQKILHDNGLSLEESVRELAFIMGRAEKEETRLKAVDLALTLNGVKDEKDKRETPTIIFNIQSNNLNLNQILCPQR